MSAPAKQPRPPISEETRARLRAAKLGVPKSAAHVAAISAGIRRWNAEAEPWQRRRGFRRLLDDEEADYRLLRWRWGYSEAEALTAVGRGDLVESS